MLYQCVAHAARWIWEIAHCSCHNTYPVLWLFGFSQIAEKQSFPQSSQQKLSTVSHLEQEKVMSCYLLSRKEPRDHSTTTWPDVHRPPGRCRKRCAKGSRREQEGAGGSGADMARQISSATCDHCNLLLWTKLGRNWDHFLDHSIFGYDM